MEGKTAMFCRQDGHSLELGAVVAYSLVGIPFRIMANRDGVRVEGQFPLVGKIGIEVLKLHLDKALKQHEHLATFAIGEKQTALSEEALILGTFAAKDVQ